VADSTIDQLQIREWVYDSLRRGKRALPEVARDVYTKANPSLPARPLAAYEIPTYISEPVRGIIWELILQAIVLPGTGLGSGSGDPGLPFFQITEWVNAA
jgi:hypothetical protein